MDRRHRLIAEINIIPLVDVVLVLLIIFMVTAPMLYQGIDIKLPAATTNTIRPEERKIITIGETRKIYLDDSEVLLSDLSKTLEALKADTPQISIYLRADRDVPYGTVVSVMDIIKQVGIDKLGMVTEPTGLK